MHIQLNTLNLDRADNFKSQVGVITYGRSLARSMGWAKDIHI